MKVEELRAIEEFLDEAAELGMSLNEARRWIAARILGADLHEMFPENSIGFFEHACNEFLGRWS